MCLQHMEQLQLEKAMRFQLSQLLAERDNVDKRNPQIIKILKPFILSLHFDFVLNTLLEEPVRSVQVRSVFSLLSLFLRGREMLIRQGKEAARTEKPLFVRAGLDSPHLSL